MARRGIRGDWVDLAVCLFLLAGTIASLQGVIAIVRHHYYTLNPNEILVVDLKTWGWILLGWGLLVCLTGIGLWYRSNAVRVFAIVIALLNMIAELGFAGAHNYPLWGLAENALTILVLYALIIRWEGADSGT